MDAVTRYLREIRNIPLLSSKEEKELAKKIKAGDKQAKEKLIKGNLRLVVSIAKKSAKLYRGVSFSELIEGGNLGLVIAADKFDPSKGKFSTFAWWHIKGAIFKLYSDKYIVTCSNGKKKKLSTYKKIRADLHQKLKREPTMQEIAEKAKTNIKKIKKLEDLERYTGTEELTESPNMKPLRKETNIGNIDEMADFLKRERIAELLKEYFPPKVRKILSLRFGLKDGITYTLRDIAKHFGVSKQAIKKREDGVMRKLKKIILGEENMKKSKRKNK